MKRKAIVNAAIGALGAIAAITSFAQPAGWWQGSGGWGMHAPYARMYNPKTVQSFSGEVQSVDRVDMMHGMHYGVHLTVKTDGETRTVVLGPEWYITRQDAQIQKGDKVEVTGSQVDWAGQPVIIAAQLKKGDEVLTLRDEQGYPAWMGWRKRPVQ